MHSKPPLRARRPARVHGNTIKAIVIGGATATAVAGFAAYAVITRAQATDAQHCIVGATPQRSVYLLVDLTDTLSATQLQRVRSEATRLGAELREADRLEIIALAAAEPQKPAAVKTLFAGCRPRSPERAGFDRGSRVLERELEAAWTGPIQASLDAISQHNTFPASTSPLLTSMKELAMRSVGRQRKLVLVSDLMESEVANAYKTRGFDFRQLQNTEMDAVRVEGLLADFDVRVFELIDTRRLQQQTQARAFWSQYFTVAGARVEFSRI
jgi:hypothetical protein